MPDTFETLKEMFGKTPWYLKIYYWLWRQVSNTRFFLSVRLPCFFIRGKNGYSYMDVWSIDHYLCSFMPNAIQDLIDSLHGAPPDLFDDDAENQTWKWEEVLGKIRDGFLAGRSLIDTDYIEIDDSREVWLPKQEKLQAKFDEGMDLFKKYFFNLWD